MARRRSHPGRNLRQKERQVSRKQKLSIVAEQMRDQLDEIEQLIAGQHRCQRNHQETKDGRLVTLGSVVETYLCVMCMNEYMSTVHLGQTNRKLQQTRHLLEAAKNVGDFDAVVKYDDLGNDLENAMHDEVMAWLKSTSRT